MSPRNKTSPSSATEPASIRNTAPSEWGWLLRLFAQAATVLAVIALSLFLVGAAQRIGWIRSPSGDNPKSAAAGRESLSDDDRYICPMMCTPPLSQPGRCPVCGMKLVKAPSGLRGDGKSVTIEPAARRLVGIQTSLAKTGQVNRTIRTVGSIDFDQSRLATISAYTDGRLEELFANYVGVRVSRGDDLALVYSPQLYSAQTEFVTSLSENRGGRFDLDKSDLAEMAAEKLSELGMSDQQIETLRESKLPQSRIRIQSPQTGTVIEKSAVQGDYVQTGQSLFRIADLSSVWLMLDLFPNDAAAVRFGQEVEAEIQSHQGDVFSGRVAFIAPTVDPQTRTVRVRVEMMNFDRKLRPGDYATARISVPALPSETVYDPALAGKYISPMHPQVIRDDPGLCPLCGMDLVPTSEHGFSDAPLPAQNVITVPRDAVLMAGNGGVVYVETEPGRFEVRRVTVGPLTRAEAVIVEGLVAGETVATGGNFLIDSQMQLAGNPSLLDPSRAPLFADGPLDLPDRQTIVLTGPTGIRFDQAYEAYFEIQRAMAADTRPPPLALNRLYDGLATLERSDQIPDEARRELGQARRTSARLDGPLDEARAAFRTVSQAMLRAATVARGPDTGQSLTHYYCPMVPGNGGDWMQPGGELANPYWGSEMLTCGEVVRDLALPPPSSDGRKPGEPR